LHGKYDFIFESSAADGCGSWGVRDSAPDVEAGIDWANNLHADEVSAWDTFPSARIWHDAATHSQSRD